MRYVGPLDATLPPTPVRELLAASGATLFVLATDASLIATIRRAADQHPLFVVGTWSELLEAVQSGRCGIALLDAAVLGSRVAHCVAVLGAYAGRLVTLVAADRTVAQEYVGFLSDGRIHRLLIKPPAVGAVRLLIESATARRLQLREEPANGDARDGVVTRSTRLPKFPKWVWAGGAAASVAALIGAAVLDSQLGWWNRPDAAEAGAALPAAAAPAVPTLEERLADYRARAELALQDGRLTEPAGDNAFDHYLTVLALAPADQAARGGISSVVDALFTRAEEALLAGSLEVTAAALDHVRRVDAASSRLAFLDAQLARALAALPLPAAVPETAPAPTELDSVLSLATTRLRRGQLLSPAGDSARAYLDRAAELAPGDPRVLALRADLAAALIAAARLVSDVDVAAAANLAADVRRLGVESADLVALDRELGAARTRAQQQRHVEQLATASARVQSGALFAPAGDGALDHLAALQAEAPTLDGLAEAWETFRQAAVLVIQGALDRGEWAVAESQLAALARAPGGADAAAPLEAGLAAGRLQETYLATASPVSILTLLSTSPAVYPPEARARGIEGWVDLEFVVDRGGQPRSLVVIESEPRGRFDTAALEAVEQHRYVPFELDGRVYERRVRLRVRFQLQ